jgi:DNA-binding LytR/AlgR family response regulator
LALPIAIPLIYNFTVIKKCKAMTSTHIHIGARKKIESECILYFQSDLNYTKVFLVDGQMIFSSTTLKKIEGRLIGKPEFLRINRGIVINLNHVKTYQETSVELTNDISLAVSRRRKVNLNVV